MSVGSIGASVSLTLTNGGLLASWVTGALALNQAGTRFTESIVTVPVSAITLPLVMGTGTVGYVMIMSLDVTTNNILYLMTTTGATTGAAVMEFASSEVALFKVGPGMQTPAISAGSTASAIKMMAFEL